jgi:tRNA pseudouridine65 synthase
MKLVAVPPGVPELPVLYRDEHVVAVHKPAGMLVHRTGLDAPETRFVVQALRAQLRCRVHPVHRLDKGASGVLLLALDADAAAALGESVRQRRLRRTYLAVVRGWTGETGTIDHPLRRIVDPAERRPGARDDGDASGGVLLPAVTHYRRLATVELPHRVDRYPTSRYGLLELSPETGRRHQLRRHLHHASHPIVGDTTYGKGRHNRLFAERFGVARLLLACVEVSVPHPARGGEPFVVTAPLAPDFARVVEALGWTVALPSAWRS